VDDPETQKVQYTNNNESFRCLGYVNFEHIMKVKPVRVDAKVERTSVIIEEDEHGF
jgi:hypothetical protein